MKLSRGHDFECEVRLFHDSLTHQQRRMYRLWLDEIAQQTGDDAEALHEDFLLQFAPRIVRQRPDGRTVEIIKRTGSGRSDMNKMQMGEYMDKVYRAATVGGNCVLTQPLQDSTW